MSVDVQEQFSPISDIVLRLLFSAAHNRLLYEMIQGKFLQQDPRRVLVLLDEHDDFFLGKGKTYDSRNIHIGNWGASGVIQQQWNQVVHLSRKYSHNHDLIQIRDTAIPLGRFEKQFEIAEVDLVRLEIAVPFIMQLLEGKNFIYSHDADEFADWHSGYDNALKTLLNMFVRHPDVDLIHFTPSPAYCSPETAIPQWDLLREVYAEF